MFARGLFLMLWLLFFSIPLIHADEYPFPKQFDLPTDSLTFRGAGTKSYLFIRVFVAGFYAPPQISADQILSDVPKRLEVRYSFRVPGKKLAQETRRRIQMNVTTDEFAKIKDRVDLMDAYFVDLSPGDVYALTYVPGQGTQFAYNNRLVGTIPGADFAAGLFAVWFGPKPLDTGLRSRLLGEVQ